MKRSRRAGRSPALVLAALLALFCQIFVVQTHVHLRTSSEVVHAAAKTRVSAGVASPGTRDDQLNCPICRELAQAGHWLSPTPPAIAATLVSLLLLLVAVAAASPAIDRPRRWHNRGPPQPLTIR